MSSKPKNRKKKQQKQKQKAEARKLKKQQKKKNRQKYLIKEAASYIIIILVAVLLASHLNVVVSGSMEPSFYRGDIVAVENTNLFGIQEFNPENDVHVGDVVVYDATWYPEPVVHRVIDEQTINGTKYFEIKGDNNPKPDPALVTSDQIKAKVLTIGGHLIVIPKIGYITLAFRGL
ncbi:signal peptidase I [Methanosphaera cuniculi]|uniref:Signal peptidase I W n=1 Tax=Methanosphaera cuniculi TaxID=1077256 RepID=A0A2V2BTS6_9EURY|nr:signal peptidase I [Methanosphaera cuniculi]PWL08848.1 signal peptidase I W [Methanosphaera cuniculi]